MNKLFVRMTWVVTVFVMASGFPTQGRAEEKRKPKFTVGKDTTYVTGPIDEDGYVDYIVALNERLSKGVTPANNSVVLLWQAMGPMPEGSRMPADFFKWLGCDEPAENAAHQFKYLHKLFVLEPQQRQELNEQLVQAGKRPWKAADHPQIAQWLLANEKALVVVHNACKRTQYYSPLVTTKRGRESGGLISVLLPGVQKCREFANVLTCRAMRRIGEGQYSGAWQDLLTCHRLGRLVSNGGTLIEALVGIAIDAIASHADLVYLETVKLNAKQLAAHLADLQKLPKMAPMADKIDVAERFMFLDSVMMLDRHGANYLKSMLNEGPDKSDVLGDLTKHTIHWDLAMRTANRSYDRIVAALKLPNREQRDQELTQFDTELKALKKPFEDRAALAKAIAESKEPDKFVGKLVGDVLVGLLMPAISKVIIAGERAEQTSRNLQVAFALTAYRVENRQYPNELAALAPKYLAQVPLDLFSGKALIYRPAAAGYHFYSVGPNGKDEQGRWFDDEPRGDDPGVRMPLKQLSNK